MKTSMVALIENGFGPVPLRTRSGRAWWLPVLVLLATTVAVKADDFGYATNSDNTITITNYTGSGGAVTIPVTINGLQVTGIGDWAFCSCTGLTSVTIGNGVTNIGNEPLDSPTLSGSTLYGMTLGGDNHGTAKINTAPAGWSRA